ncbi:MAG: 50S ribosomal protein L16 [Candidatus Parcubacteria bacterium]|nr:MAG: 50S ribosomal protein L16 [Candidatus Parcubacteria bacterium]
MLQPAKLKHRKWMKGKRLKEGIATSNIDLNFGNYGLKSLENKYLKNMQIEAALKEIKRILSKKGRVWLKIFPYLSRTKKAEGVRMGGGKGDIDHYATLVRPGTIIFEIETNNNDLAIKALKSASCKLPIKTKIIVKDES